MNDATRLNLSQRTEAEQDAYMAGQLAALKLAREKGIDYAENVIEASQNAIRWAREETKES